MKMNSGESGGILYRFSDCDVCPRKYDYQINSHIDSEMRFLIRFSYVL